MILAATNRENEPDSTSPYVQEIVVSDRDVAYPLRDVLTFDYRPEEVFVYVSVSGLPDETSLRTTVVREGRGSVLSRLTGRGALSVEEVSDDLAPDGRDASTVSGVVKLRVVGERERLPSGRYRVEVRLGGLGGAERRFVVSGL